MHRAISALALAMAWLGGLVLSAVVLLTCASIAGRALQSALNGLPDGTGWAEAVLATGIGPIFGDIELVEAGVAFAIFAFLPLCQLRGGHATVDVLADRLPDRVNRVLGAAIEVAFAATLILIAVQLMQGMLGKMRTGQTSFLIEFPVWWAYAASLLGAAAAALVGVYTAAMRLRGRDPATGLRA